MRDVAVVGFATSPWQERRADKTFRALALEAAKGALAHAGLRPSDVRLVVYSLFSEVMLRQQIPTLMLQEYLGFQGGASLRVEAAEATEGYALNLAVSHVRAGLSDVVMVLGLQKTSDFYDFASGSREDGYRHATANATDATWLQPVLPCTEAFLTAAVIKPWLARHPSIRARHLAQVVVKNRGHAAANAEALHPSPLGIDDVLGASMVAEPTTAMMCAGHADGASALILASGDRARELAGKPVWIAGIATSSSAPHRGTADHLGRLLGTRIAADKAYAAAGITDPARQFDLAQVHDLVSAAELIACEELRLCGAGGSGAALDDGEFSAGGRVPVNIDGGRIACGHAPAVSGIYAAGEIVRQLREEAGPRQVTLRNGRGILQCVDRHGGMNSVAVFERN